MAFGFGSPQEKMRLRKHEQQNVFSPTCQPAGPEQHARITVFPAGPKQQSPDQSGPRPEQQAWIRVVARTASPDYSKPRIRVVPASKPRIRVVRRTRTASPGSEWSPPDLNSKPLIRGPEQQAPENSGPRRTQTASPGSERSPTRTASLDQSGRPNSKPGL